MIENERELSAKSDESDDAETSRVKKLIEEVAAENREAAEVDL